MKWRSLMCASLFYLKKNTYRPRRLGVLSVAWEHVFGYEKFSKKSWSSASEKSSDTVRKLSGQFVGLKQTRARRQNFRDYVLIRLSGYWKWHLKQWGLHLLDSFTKCRTRAQLATFSGLWGFFMECWCSTIFSGLRRALSPLQNLKLTWWPHIISEQGLIRFKSGHARKNKKLIYCWETRDRATRKHAKDYWNGRGNDNLGWNDLQGHQKWHQSTASVWFPISSL